MFSPIISILSCDPSIETLPFPVIVKLAVGSEPSPSVAMVTIPFEIVAPIPTFSSSIIVSSCSLVILNGITISCNWVFAPSTLVYCCLIVILISPTL